MGLSNDNKRIAKNIVLLYLRLLVGAFVSFYTTRVVLEALGVVDYGIKNAVGGIAVLFQFLNSMFTTADQRFLAFDMGQGDYKMMNITFNLSMYIHAGLALLIIAITEVVGLWLLYNEMIIPAERMNAAFWVFQLSLVGSFFSLTQAPYLASIYAYEKMDVIAYFGLLSVIINLAIALAIQYSTYDRLICFSVLTAVCSIALNFLYRWYCVKHFKAARLRLVWHRGRFKEMLNFAGWVLAEQFAKMGRTSGINILINIFFGPTVNAARGVAMSVYMAITNFSAAFVNTLTPQITKNYAKENYDKMNKLVIYGSKYTFFLFLLLALPVILETDFLLGLWLVEPPAMASNFCQLVLIVSLIDMTTFTVGNGVLATGKVRSFQVVMSTINILIPIFSYVLYKFGYNPLTYLYVELMVCVLSVIIRPVLFGKLTGMNVLTFMQKVVLKDILVSLLALPIPLFLISTFESSYSRMLLNILTIEICAIAAIWFVGIDSGERIRVKEIVVDKINKWRNLICQ